MSKDNFYLWIGFESFQINVLANMNVKIAYPAFSSRREVFDRDNVVVCQKPFAKLVEIKPFGIVPLKGIVKIEAVDVDDCFPHEYPRKSKGHLSVACAQPPKQLGVYDSKYDSSFLKVKKNSMTSKIDYPEI